MSHGYVAGGNVRPARLVKYDTTLPAGRVIEATGATVPFVGVAQPGTRQTPLSGLDDGYAAISGENLAVYTIGDTCMVRTGAAVTVGDLLTSDGSAQAITTTTDGHFYAGQAMQSAPGSGYLIEMRVEPGQRGS